MRCNPVTRVPGSGYEKPSNTESAKQLQERMAKLHAERAKQDAIWTIQPEPEQKPVPVAVVINSIPK